MKQYQKVNCPQCIHYKTCPQKTRMLVNYCGSRSGDIKDAMLAAVQDCRMRHGLIFKRDTRSIPVAGQLQQAA